LERDYVFPQQGSISKTDLATWLFWTEIEFLPRNESIKQLLKTKAHLIDSPQFHASYVTFLDHCNSWAVKHRRWKEQQTPSSMIRRLLRQAGIIDPARKANN
jgi:hypothetical protein